MAKNLFEKIHKSLQDKEHIIWDWNGTLLDDVGHAVNTVNSLLEEHQLPLIDPVQYRRLFEFPVINYYRKLGFDFQRESFESLCHRFVDRFMDGVVDLPLVADTRRVVVRLHSENKMQSILSATDQDNLDSMIRHFQLQTTFKYVYGINNKLAASKIDRGHELIRNSGIPVERTVIVGDTLHDLDVAKALGIDAVLIGHGHQCANLLKEHHHQVIEA